MSPSHLKNDLCAPRIRIVSTKALPSVFQTSHFSSSADLVPSPLISDIDEPSAPSKIFADLSSDFLFSTSFSFNYPLAIFLSSITFCYACAKFFTIYREELKWKCTPLSWLQNILLVTTITWKELLFWYDYRSNFSLSYCATSFSANCIRITCSTPPRVAVSLPATVDELFFANPTLLIWGRTFSSPSTPSHSSSLYHFHSWVNLVQTFDSIFYSQHIIHQLVEFFKSRSRSR